MIKLFLFSELFGKLKSMIQASYIMDCVSIETYFSGHMDSQGTELNLLRKPDVV